LIESGARRALYRASCSTGRSTEENNVGFCLEHGHGACQNIKASGECYRFGADVGHPDGEVNYQRSHRLMRSPELPTVACILSIRAISLWPRAPSTRRRAAPLGLEEKGSLVRAIIGHSRAYSLLRRHEAVDPIHHATVELEVLHKRPEFMITDIKQSVISRSLFVCRGVCRL
jgi:TPR repeat protein